MDYPAVDLQKKEDKIERDLVWIFDAALIIKILNGALEVLAALFIFFVPPTFVIKLAQFVTGGELTQDASDIVETTIQNAAHAFAVNTHYLIASYLALHGIVKIVLVAGIFAKKRIAYPLFMVALGIFGAYEAYRGFFLHERLLLILAIFDLSLLVLTSYEYRRRYPAPAA